MNLSITLKYIRDLRNILKKKLNSKQNYATEHEAAKEILPEHEIFLEVELSIEENKVVYSQTTDAIKFNNLGKDTVIFPIKIKDLPIHTAIAITIYDCNKSKLKSLIGSTAFYLFDCKRRLRQGAFNLKIWKNQSRDLSYKFRTPGFPTKNSIVKEINVLLNKLSNKSHDRKEFKTHDAIKNKLHQLYLDSDDAFLEIKLPDFDYPIIFDEVVYNMATQIPLSFKDYINPEKDKKLAFESSIKSFEEMKSTTETQKLSLLSSKIMRFHDCTVSRPMFILNPTDVYTNPVSEKYYILTRTDDDSIVKRLTPDGEVHSQLLSIIEKPDFIQLTPKEKNLLWKYRYSLKTNESYRNGIVKFLMSVNWDNSKEKQEAIEMLQEWSINQEEALPMLSVSFCANEYYTPLINDKCCNEIRRLAINCLDKLDINSIKMILLQLAQAYRYEDFDEGYMKNFFLSKVTQNEDISHSFYWVVKLEKDYQNASIPEIQVQYDALLTEFMSLLGTENPELKESLLKQLSFRSRLFDISTHIQTKGNVASKKAELRTVLNKGEMFDMTSFESTPMPLDPSVEVCGIVPEECSVFPSAKCPLQLTFIVSDKTLKLNNPRVNGKFYKVMFKQDDDCRQDQLVLQMIDLMDDLLKQINYDFKFTVYKVIAFSEKDGMIEFVPNCRTINHILYNYESKIELYLANVSKKSKIDYPKIFETYLDSCAGYCVVTYLLGIGDRHLDNLLIDETGHLFHVDFGYIFGKNPKNKGLMPPIRICSEMIECMGGIKSKDYKKFLEKCVNAFCFLRIHSKYILNLLHLMIHAEIVDLPAQNYEETLNQIYMKFLPELKDRAEVEKEFSRLIEQSIDQLFARIFEMFHNFSQGGQ